jgi:hypothetical protein
MARARWLYLFVAPFMARHFSALFVCLLLAPNAACPLQLLWPYGRTLLGCRAAAQQCVLIGLQNTIILTASNPVVQCSTFPLRFSGT